MHLGKSEFFRCMISRPDLLQNCELCHMGDDQYCTKM